MMSVTGAPLRLVQNESSMRRAALGVTAASPTGQGRDARPSLQVDLPKERACRDIPLLNGSPRRRERHAVASIRPKHIGDERTATAPLCVRRSSRLGGEAAQQSATRRIEQLDRRDADKGVPFCLRGLYGNRQN